MAQTFKLHLDQTIGFYIEKKLVSVGPRGTVTLTEKDIESSPQAQVLLARNELRKLPHTKEKASAAPDKPGSESKDKPQNKD